MTTHKREDYKLSAVEYYLTKDKTTSVPYICYLEGDNDCDKNNYLGMNKNCKKCKRYVKKGIL